MLAELKSLKLMPDLYTFNAVLDACFLHNDWQLALVVLSVSGRRRIAASIRIRVYEVAWIWVCGKAVWFLRNDVDCIVAA
jgi:hypothetical protein